jgi:hypothetical protein
LNLKSEVGRGDLTQSAGRECHSSGLAVFEKYASAFLMSSRLSILRHLILANFGIQVETSTPLADPPLQTAINLLGLQPKICPNGSLKF